MVVFQVKLGEEGACINVVKLLTVNVRFCTTQKMVCYLMTMFFICCVWPGICSLLLGCHGNMHLTDSEGSYFLKYKSLCNLMIMDF